MRLILFLSVLLVLGACEMAPQGGSDQESISTAKSAQAASQKPDEVSSASRVITGHLTDEGVMCQAMRGEDGTLYVFENIPEDLNIGDELRVERDIASDPMPSYCDQGKVIMWTMITKLDNGKPGQVWRQDN